MGRTITIYDDINDIKQFFRYNKYADLSKDIDINEDINEDKQKQKQSHTTGYNFNSNKYCIGIRSDLGMWIQSELNQIDAIDGKLYVLNDMEKIIQLRDKIWNDEMENEPISDDCNGITFAYEAYHWIKEGKQLYFFVF